MSSKRAATSDQTHFSIGRALDELGFPYLRGATYLRAGILNTQSTVDDIDDLLALLRRLARTLDTD